MSFPSRRSLFALQLLVALAAGWLQAYALSQNSSAAPWWVLQIVATAVLYILLRASSSVGVAALIGWVFATSWIAFATSWISISLHVYGGLPAGLAIVCVIALAAFLALYFAVAAAASKALADSVVSEWLALPSFAALWMLAELARNSWFTGFPWAASGYAHIDGPLVFWAPYFGVYGIGFAASLLAGALAWLVWRRTRSAALAYGLLVLALFVAPHLVPPSGAGVEPSHAPMRIALLQGNIAQGEKFEPSTGVQDALKWYGQQLRASSASLTVTPETAIPLLPDELPQGYWLDLQQTIVRGGKAALVGMPLGSEEQGYTNAVVGIKPSAAATHYAYFKHHLVPFGEFIPPFFRWFTRMLNIPLGDFARGARAQASFAWQGERLAPNICYEDVFGEELAARFSDTAQAPTIFVNMSNLGWFGNGKVLNQHLNMSRMRSRELDRPMLRATNTGMTAAIDRHGQVHALLPRTTRGVLQVQLGGNTGTTFFVRWAAAWGLLPLWAFGLTLVFSALLLGALGRRIKLS